MKTTRRHDIEKLESRRYLTVTASVTDGDLMVQGQADGTVEIRAIDEGKFLVTDNGNEVATLEGVSDDIRIKLDTEGTDTNDKVTVDLAGQAVDQVFVELGNGDNEFELQGGTVRGMLRYLGGAGDDGLTIDADVIVEGPVVAQLRSGNDRLDVAGQLQRELLVFAGSGDDAVQLTEDCRVEGSVYLVLGDGQNIATVAGEINGSLVCHGGAGDDSVTLSDSALVRRSVHLALGEGDNTVELAGTVLGNVQYCGGDGSDTVTIASGAAVAGNVTLRLGDGTNTVDHAGTSPVIYACRAPTRTIPSQSRRTPLWVGPPNCTWEMWHRRNTVAATVGPARRDGSHQRFA